MFGRKRAVEERVKAVERPVVRLLVERVQLHELGRGHLARQLSRHGVVERGLEVAGLLGQSGECEAGLHHGHERVRRLEFALGIGQSAFRVGELFLGGEFGFRRIFIRLVNFACFAIKARQHTSRIFNQRH